MTCIDQGIGTNRLLNPTNFPVYLHPTCRIAKAQPIDKYCIHTLGIQFNKFIQCFGQ